jgi:hypothetical protein
VPIESTPALHPPRRAEIVLFFAFIALLASALLLPAIHQDPSYHRFADQRTWLGVPHAANVLSNLAFIAVGLFGSFTLLSSHRLTRATVTSPGCVAAGFVLTGIGSIWYHAQPNDATLVWDRLPMTLVLAGVIAAAIAVRVGDGVAHRALLTLIIVGTASVLYWRASGNLTPYAVLQLGGLAALVILLVATHAESDPFSWAWIVGWYCFAKAAELGDSLVWQWSGGIVAGHTIKHLAAAATGAAMFYPLRRTTAARPRCPTPV